MQRLLNVFAFQVWIVGKQLLNANVGTDLADDHADSDPHTPNAGPSAHHVGTLRDAVKISHGLSFLKLIAMIEL
jgi:hypothetical protein